MKGNGFRWMAQTAILMAAVSLGASGQWHRDVVFRGTISDYTPQNMPASVGGPYQVQGHWSLTIRQNGKADFSAAVNMERSDLGVMNSGGGDLNNPADRNAHTHHITLANGSVSFPSQGTIEVTGGTVTITANGAIPPPFGANSSLKIDIVGGNSVTFSNVKVTFIGDAVKHFGMSPLSGVVRSVR
jgi:hypothetical protein